MARRRKAKDEGIKLVPAEDVGAAGASRARVNRYLSDYYDRHGQVDANGLLEEATDPSCPIHEDFEWNDSVAAHKFRVKQAQAMIMAWKMVAILKEQRNKPPTTVTHKVKVRSVLPGPERNVFWKRDQVKANPVTRSAQVDRYLNRLRSWCDETIDFEELDGLRTMILEAVESTTP